MPEQLDLFAARTVENSSVLVATEDVDNSECDVPCSLCFEVSGYKKPYRRNGWFVCERCIIHYCGKHINPEKRLCFRCITKGRW